jgi:hypothetical protein
MSDQMIWKRFFTSSYNIPWPKILNGWLRSTWSFAPVIPHMPYGLSRLPLMKCTHRCARVLMVATWSRSFWLSRMLTHPYTWKCTSSIFSLTQEPKARTVQRLASWGIRVFILLPMPLEESHFTSLSISSEPPIYWIMIELHGWSSKDL